jgi:hypothetical protein
MAWKLTDMVAAGCYSLGALALIGCGDKVSTYHETGGAKDKGFP